MLERLPYARNPIFEASWALCSVPSACSICCWAVGLESEDGLEGLMGILDPAEVRWGVAAVEACYLHVSVYCCSSDTSTIACCSERLLKYTCLSVYLGWCLARSLTVYISMYIYIYTQHMHAHMCMCMYKYIIYTLA